ncbi:bifunctional transcriptional activator/DNA repair enzyme AdaA [Candidiatus Paracoxiella cheracis]|uniref:bifunctional transcriptional activator/DNA repair enzyme AdaA n=1 Tax=Candidiatus Paracoxiella cheracis TaxID=3405120 RepID=UPI003BF48564
MTSNKKKHIYYKALLEKQSKYEGLFFVGVSTTGVFCRPTCPARKPKYNHCDFFETAKEALLAGYRPCKRCHPLTYQNDTHPIVKKLVAAIEESPEKRWKTADLKMIGIDDSTARRQFKKRYGLTFIEYARARRMGLALENIKSGSKVIDAQFETGYESSSGFRDAFSRILGDIPTKTHPLKIVKAELINTPLGSMIAVADEEGLYLLEFVDRRGLEREIERLRKRVKIGIIPGSNPILESIEQELSQYFKGSCFIFKTPIHLLGSEFQLTVWNQLQLIPIGQTRSYLELAKTIHQPKAFRAVARANGSNPLAIIIPCHRVINTNGDLGGYGGGLDRKSWLLKHEKALLV